MKELQLALDWADRTPAAIVVGIVACILILLVGRWLAKRVTRLASRSMERAHVDTLVIRFTETLIYVGLMVAVITAALRAAGIHTISLTALLASVGLAIGLALKDSLSNVAAGIMILSFKPYTVADSVEAAGAGGSVEEVSIFNTTLRTGDNVKVIVPNSAAIRGTIKNFSAYGHRRIDLVAAIGYEDNIGLARDILMTIMTSHPLVLSDPAPAVEVLDLAATHVNLAVRPWARTQDYWQVRCEVLEQMKLRFEEAGIGASMLKRQLYVLPAA
jgi:small conductance mechanosensitive channel